MSPDLRCPGLRLPDTETHGRRSVSGSLCNHHAIPVYGEAERQARNEMSASEASDVLGVTPTIVLRLIRLKPLPATQAWVGAPWIMRRADVERCMAERNHPATPPTVDSAQLAIEIP